MKYIFSCNCHPFPQFLIICKTISIWAEVNSFCSIIWHILHYFESMWTFHPVTLTIKTDEIIRCAANIQFLHIEFGNILKVFCQVHSLFNYLLLILNNNMITVICHYTLLQARIFDCVSGGSKNVSVKWTGVNNISQKPAVSLWNKPTIFLQSMRNNNEYCRWWKNTVPSYTQI